VLQIVYYNLEVSCLSLGWIRRLRKNFVKLRSVRFSSYIWLSVRIRLTISRWSQALQLRDSPFDERYPWVSLVWPIHRRFKVDIPTPRWLIWDTGIILSKLSRSRIIWLGIDKQKLDITILFPELLSLRICNSWLLIITITLCVSIKLSRICLLDEKLHKRLFEILEMKKMFLLDKVFSVAITYSSCWMLSMELNTIEWSLGSAVLCSIIYANVLSLSMHCEEFNKFVWFLNTLVWREKVWSKTLVLLSVMEIGSLRVEVLPTIYAGTGVLRAAITLS